MKLTYKNLLLIIAPLCCMAIAPLWWVVIGHRSAVGNTAKWLLLSPSYKAEVSAQPNSTNGELKHVEWDGWGWAGMDTVVYLVFDPTDSLSQAAINHQPGK